MVSWQIVEPQLKGLVHFLQPPKASDNKYTRGVLGVIAGSDDFPGAAILNIESALHTGLGLIRYLGDSKLATKIIKSRPEVVFAEGSVDGFLVGSGIINSARNSESISKIVAALNTNLPVIVDAGALDLAIPGRKLQLLTPHSGELAKLLTNLGVNCTSTDVLSNPLKYVEFASEKLNTAVLLKGNTTYVADCLSRTVFVVKNIEPRLATAGSGDVLAGVIAGLMVQQKNITQSEFVSIAILGILLHAAAAKELAVEGPFAALELVSVIAKLIAKLVNVQGK